MTQISRRNVAKGAAWSIPAVAVASSAPAFAASTTPETPATACSDAGCQAPFWPSNGTMSYTVQGGFGASDTTVQINYGMNGPAAESGSVSVLYYDGAGQTSMPRPWITLADGSSRIGTVTLGGTASYVIPSGVNSSMSVQFNDTMSTSSDGLLNGATVNVPAKFVWTDSATGEVRNCTILATFKLRPTGAYSAGNQQLAAAPVYSTLDTCASAATPVISSVTPDRTPAGQNITVAGSNLTGGTFTVNGKAATVVSNDGSTAVITVPADSGIWGTQYPIEVTTSTGKYVFRTWFHG